MEMPPLRTFLFLVTFLAVFGILVGTMPSGFVEASDEYREQEIPTEEFRVKDLEAYAETLMITMNETGGYDVGGLWYYFDVDIGGHDCYLRYKCANKSNLEVMFWHRYTVWWFVPTAHQLTWVNKAGITRNNGAYGGLSVEELESDYPEYLPYGLSCSHFSLDASFNYNASEYSSVEDAWNHHGLTFFIGIEFDQMATGLNAWDLISMVLFFKMPNVHPILNYIISVPIWVSIIWLATSIIIAFIKSLPLT